MSGEAKVLTGLLQRRALEQAFAELGRIADPAAVQRQAQTIAEYGSAALQHLLTLLDTPDPQLRGGLGQVARHLPREQVVAALRGAARDHERSDQARLTAVTLLERFLDENIDDALIDNLGNPDVAAQQSLAELVAAMDEEPVSVLEYLEQLSQQPPEVVGMVLDALPSVEPSPHLATFLRMLAQGENARLARRTIDELIKLRTPAAVRALASLVPNLPPTLAPLADRGLRKLRFSGLRESDDHDSRHEPWYAPQLRWRVLISPVDAFGGQFLWFVGREEASGEPATKGGQNRAVFFTVLTQEPYGLRDASGSLQAEADHVPPKRREGAVHFIVGDDGAPGLTLLEAPFSLGCTALREALALNWVNGEPTPIGYRLFSPLVWLAEESGEISDFAPEPDPLLTEAELFAALDHPAFRGWFQYRELDAGRVASCARRFRAMSRWFELAGDPADAAIAATLAYHFVQQTPQALSILAALQARASDGLQEQQDQSKENRNA